MADIQLLVISLVGSDERQKKVKSELDKTNLSWRFLDAIRGSALTSPPIEYSAEKVKRLLGFELTSNELGCFLSHKKAWQECVDKNMITIIFEDDFYLLPHFKGVVQFLSNNLAIWDAVRLQGLNNVRQELIQDVGEFSLVRNLGDAVGATAYIVKPHVAKKLIAAANDIYEPLDHFLEHHQKHQLTILAINPYPVDITGVETTITDRPSRQSIKGLAKSRRSFFRAIDRWFSKNPWFPK
jgi:glycosyl transferase family 25